LPDGGTLGHPSVHLNDRAAGDDDLVLVPPVPSAVAGPDRTGWVRFNNYVWFFNSPDFWVAIVNTPLLVGGVLVITVVLGVLIALPIDQPIWGQGPLRILVISPFFVMPPVAASIWENVFMHPQNGLLASVSRGFGYDPILYLESYPMASVIFILSWEWLPFTTLILLTALQSMSSEQLEAAEMDGASAVRLPGDHCRHPCQYRRHLPDARHRQASGRLRGHEPWPVLSPYNGKSSTHWPLGPWV